MISGDRRTLSIVKSGALTIGSSRLKLVRKFKVDYKHSKRRGSVSFNNLNNVDLRIK